MLTPENRERIFSSPMFPLELKSVQYGLDWMRDNIPTTQQRKKQALLMKNEQPPLFSFISQMSIARRMLNMRQGSLFNGYMNGSLFMFYTLKDQYIQKGKLLKIPSYNQMNTYISDLFNIEYHQPHIQELRKNKEQIQPAVFPILYEVTKSKSTKEAQLLQESFRLLSESKVKTMFEEEPLVKEALTHGRLVQSFGPLDGLKFGALDIYEIFRAQEESQALNHIWNIQIK